MRYLEVAQAIRERIALGEVGAGGSLESENALARRYGVSRMTLRKAMERLRAEGLITARRGAGWFVAVDAVRQTLGRFPTIEAAVADAGLSWERRVLEFGFVEAEPEVSRSLALADRAEVLRVRRLTLAAGDPFAIVTVWIPGDLGNAISRADAGRATFYELLPRHNVQLGSATQTIAAVLSTADDAALLHVAQGTPMLVCRRVTKDVYGAPIIFAEHRYAAHRTVFEVEFPNVSGSAGEAPAGVRLIREARS